MADGTKIEWSEATWNPITGCSVVSPGCTNCYAMRLAGTRLAHHPSRAGLTRDTKAGPVWTGEVRLNESWLDQPLRWKRPRMIFVCAHGDLFHEDVPDEWIDRAFAVMALAPQHVFQVLTKRPERMRRYVRRASASGRFLLWRHPTLGHEIIDAAVAQWPTMFRHVWLGTSVEDQARAGRIWHLAHTPAAVRWVSAEPLLSPLDAVTAGILGTDADGNPAVDWIVVGGESGPSHRPMNPDWARALRDQCAGKVAFFMKQMAGKGPIPPDLMVREWPRMTPGIRARGR